MMTAAQLAEIVSRKVELRRIGQERWAGLCPFHNEKTPSFHVLKGTDGAGYYFCHGCKESGSAKWWLVKMEGQSYREAGGRYDPKLERERKDRQRKERQLQRMLRAYRDKNPLDDYITDEFLLDHPAWLTT